MSLQPKGFDVYLKYFCECGVDYWITLAEAKSGFKVVCNFCNKVNDIKQISSAKVLINFVRTTAPDKTITVPAFKQSNIAKSAFQTLKDYGYKLSPIEELQSELNLTDATLLIKEFLARQKAD